MNGIGPKASDRILAFQPSRETAVPRGRRLSGGRVCAAVRAPPLPSTREAVWAGASTAKIVRNTAPIVLCISQECYQAAGRETSSRKKLAEKTPECAILY